MPSTLLVILGISNMPKIKYRTAAERNNATKAARRRRRILQAGFFFTISWLAKRGSVCYDKKAGR